MQETPTNGAGNRVPHLRRGFSLADVVLAGKLGDVALQMLRADPVERALVGARKHGVIHDVYGLSTRHKTSCTVRGINEHRANRADALAPLEVD